MNYMAVILSREYWDNQDMIRMANDDNDDILIFASFNSEISDTLEKLGLELISREQLTTWRPNPLEDDVDDEFNDLRFPNAQPVSSAEPSHADNTQDLSSFS